MRNKQVEPERLIDLSEISEIELIVLKKMQEVTVGEHRNQFHGMGFDFVGLRDWQAGDHFSSIDWPQSAFKNFSPLVVREFEQPSTATVIAVADVSLSTRCGIDGVSIGSAIARAVATIGMSAVFFQDLVGLITFNTGFRAFGAVPARVGRNQVIHCLQAYEQERSTRELRDAGSIWMSISSFMRRTSLMPVISDFLFDNYRESIEQLGRLNTTHDVFLVIVDSAFAFNLPIVSAGWVETVDIETKRTRLLSRADFKKLAQYAREWQDEVELAAKRQDLDVLRYSTVEPRSTIELAEFMAERRLRKT